MDGLRQAFAIARLTAYEAVRRPVTLLLSASSVLLTGFVPVINLFEFGEEGKLARDSGLACHLLFGTLVAGTAAALTVARELRSGTVRTILSKPVGRRTLLLGKYLGVAAVVVAFSWLSLVATLLAERVATKFVLQQSVYVKDTLTGMLLMALPFAAFAGAGILNYRTRRSFEALGMALMTGLATLLFVASGCIDRSGAWAPYALHVDWRIVPASLLVLLALLVLAALATTLALFLSPVPAVTALSMLFLAGLFADYLILGHLPMAVRGIGYLLPNWQHFWMADALIAGGEVGVRYLAGAALYGVLYAAGILGIGLHAAERMELG